MALVSNLEGSAQAFKVLEGGALVELLLRVLENPEDDSLGASKHHGDHVGKEHHQPKVGTSISNLLAFTSVYQKICLMIVSGMFRNLISMNM